jgi:hypothetical protein
MGLAAIFYLMNTMALGFPVLSPGSVYHGLVTHPRPSSSISGGSGSETTSQPSLFEQGTWLRN